MARLISWYLTRVVSKTEIPVDLLKKVPAHYVAIPLGGNQMIGGLSIHFNLR